MRSLFGTDDNIATPCSGKAIDLYLSPPMASNR